MAFSELLIITGVAETQLLLSQAMGWFDTRWRCRRPALTSSRAAIVPTETFDSSRSSLEF